MGGDGIVDVVSAVTQTFSIILLGFVLAYVGIIGKEVGAGLGRFLGIICLPALIFHSMATLDLSDFEFNIVAAMLMAKVSVFALVLIVSVVFRAGVAHGALWGIFATQSNDFALGLPLLNALYLKTHPDWPRYVYLLAPISLCFLNPIGFLLMELSRRKKKGDGKFCKTALKVCWGVLKNPIVSMVIVGLLYNFCFNATLPTWIDEYTSTLGQAFDAVALVTLGLSLQNTSSVTAKGALLPLGMICMKVLTVPIFAKLFTDALIGGENSKDDVTFSDFVFILGTFPTAPGVFLYARTYGLGDDAVVFGTAVGTLVSGPVMVLSAYMTNNASTDSNTWDKTVWRLQNFVGVASAGCAVLTILLVAWAARVAPSRLRHLRAGGQYALPMLLTICVSSCLYPAMSISCEGLWKLPSGGSTAARNIVWGVHYTAVQMTRVLTAALALRFAVHRASGGCGSSDRGRPFLSRPLLQVDTVGGTDTSAAPPSHGWIQTWVRWADEHPGALLAAAAMAVALPVGGIFAFGTSDFEDGSEVAQCLKPYDRAQWIATCVVLAICAVTLLISALLVFRPSPKQQSRPKTTSNGATDAAAVDEAKIVAAIAIDRGCRQEDTLSAPAYQSGVATAAAAAHETGDVCLGDRYLGFILIHGMATVCSFSVTLVQPDDHGKKGIARLLAILSLALLYASGIINFLCFIISTDLSIPLSAQYQKLVSCVMPAWRLIGIVKGAVIKRRISQDQILPQDSCGLKEAVRRPRLDATYGTADDDDEYEFDLLSITFATERHLQTHGHPGSIGRDRASSHMPLQTVTHRSNRSPSADF